MRFIILILAITVGSTSGCNRRASKAFDGVVLFAPFNSNQVQLLNPASEVVHTWESDAPPGQCVYLRPDGSLLKTARLKDLSTVFEKTYSKGSGGRVDWVEWDGSLRWSFTRCSETELLHHDIEPMENGHILMLVWVHIPVKDAVERGCRTASKSAPILSERIIEVNPANNEVVWQWDAWDHTYQLVDAELRNYSKTPVSGKFDLNVPRDPHDWLHFNSISYDASRDLIAISCRQTSEILILDHSATTEEARGDMGGKRNVGGSILARWGNQSGGRVLYHQHNANWIPKGRPGAGNLLLFNNGKAERREYSDVLELAFDESTRTFDIVWRYAPWKRSTLYSEFVSGAQRQPNGNTLICSGCQGVTIEVDPSGRECWRHTYPVTDRSDWIFRVEKYPWDYVEDRITDAVSSTIESSFSE